MAYPQRRAIDRIGDRANTIARHCMYLYLYPGAQETNHWAKEVATCLNDAQAYTNVKGGRKLSWAVVQELLIEHPVGEQRDYQLLFKQAVAHMDKKPPTRQDASYEQFLAVYTALCADAYGIGAVASSDVVNFWSIK
jgi:hypothetical protein